LEIGVYVVCASAAVAAQNRPMMAMNFIATAILLPQATNTSEKVADV
jgi:hypothetical protein